MGGEFIVFWMVVGLGIIMMVGMYFGFSNLGAGSGEIEGQVLERKEAEYQSYVKNNVVCGQVGMDSGLSFMGATPEIYIRPKNEVEVLARTSIDYGLTEVTLKGKLNAGSKNC